MPHTLFISDLHLSEQQPHLSTLFERFMADIAPEAKALYILGDFFDCWFSDKQTSDWIEHTKQQLRQLTQKGVPVFLMVGNRDFLIGDHFAKDTGCQLLADPSVIQIASHRIVMCHGDTLCTEDLAYMRYRRVIRSQPIAWLGRHLPMWLVKRIAQHIRHTSEAKHGDRHDTAKPIADVNAIAAGALCEQHQATHLLHGHTHVAGTHPLSTEKRDCQRIVLNAWDTQGHYLQWHDDGSFESVFF